MRCPNCQSETQPGQKFCPECGTRLEAACASCGATLVPGAKFCAECGAPATTTTLPSLDDAIRPASATPVAERRIVSVLFADLVGFTSASEDRDAEDTRSVLAAYFDVARAVIERYGGSLEKFIGDAVMAVWGAPTAHEDDAERAVRAALDLTTDVGRITDPGGTGIVLELRAAVLTGEAAVTLGATGQGMVAGDLVNTASRLQAVAPPGSVLVDEATRQAAERTIAFDAAGEHELKGKKAPVPAWRALRVVAGRLGQGRSEVLEAPFVGRDADLVLLRDLFHAVSREGRFRLVSITGQAGIGKSRLAWEFEKYVDGLVEPVLWHQGRSPAYGEGITFWALGEMVRRRAGLLETDDRETTIAKLATMLEQYVPDRAERVRVEPALLALLGLGKTSGDQGELFSAWRTLFERVADVGTEVLVFEDLQWADPGLVDFIEHLAEWSRDRPILVITLSRPELLERRPTWGAGRRNFTSIHLEPLPAAAMRELLSGLVPGLPDAAMTAILRRAEGVPLYAVETVRMLVGDGRIILVEGGYRATGSLADLTVPTTLQALVAARLDGLGPDDRSLVQTAAVLGMSFTAAALAGASGESEADLGPRLDGLVRRELFEIERDPASPERGQYRFVQAVLREVAYGTLARPDRRARHVAAARYFEGLGDPELAGILANQYLDAYRNAPAGPEADAIGAQARIALKAAAERASSLAANEQAVAFLRQAMDATSDPDERAALAERAAEASVAAADGQTAIDLLDGVIALYRERGDRVAEARATAMLGTPLMLISQTELAIRTFETALADLGPEPDERAALPIKQELARAYMLHGDSDKATRVADEALGVAERLDDVRAIAELLVTKGSALSYSRPREGRALLIGAAEFARGYRLSSALLRALNNVWAASGTEDPAGNIERSRQALDVARAMGRSDAAGAFRTKLAWSLTDAGRFDEALDVLDATDAEMGIGSDRSFQDDTRALIAMLRGRSEDARTLHADAIRMVEASTNQDELWAVQFFGAELAFFDGRPDDAIEGARRAHEIAPEASATGWLVAYVGMLTADEALLVEGVRLFSESPERGPTIDASRAAFEAAQAVLKGRLSDGALGFADALVRLQGLGLEFERLLCLVGAARLLGPEMADGAAAAAEARAIAERDDLVAILRLLPPAASDDTAEGSTPIAGSVSREPVA